MIPGETIKIIHASEHNLRSVSLEIPKNKLVVVTGVSGSGKSSLVFDVLYREAESCYLGSFSAFARQFMGKLKKPDVEKVEGLSPAIALDQKSVVSNPRSTVGTLTGIYDLLRLLFARAGTIPSGIEPFTVSRSLFSFNSPEGACPACKGLGVEDFLDPELLIADENRTLREGALVITTSSGYIIYSQVTMAVLDEVCRSEGFHVDIPWKDLTPEQKHIVLYGSDKIEIPYGKHPLESRMKWSGITAKPREMGHYKGILPVMEAILQRDRNKNILRFVRSGKCRVCNGQRLNEQALAVKINGHSIAALAALQLDELQQFLQGAEFAKTSEAVALPVIAQVSKQIDLLKRLGLGYLSADRESTTLSGGESQRLRLATQAGIGLSGMICIFDEPSIGLHPHDISQLITILRELRDKGNSVIVVEHDEEFIRHADWLVDIGPGPGIHGGEVLFSGTLQQAQELPLPEIRKSRTLSFVHGFEKIEIPGSRRNGNGFLTIKGAAANNLKDIDVRFMLQAMNVVTGVSGAGKSTLTNHILGAFLKNHLQDANENVGKYREISGWQGIGKLISIDQSPIGRTPRSNPATYTGLFDPVRDLFAVQPESVKKGYDKSRFSFNTAGGRCEACQGAGYQMTGMHFMGNVEVVCESCEGRRFDDETLAVTYRGKNISEILEMSVSEALPFFSGEPKILRFLETLENIGLGYLMLGQRSSTLSGGEAQRIKLATELSRPPSAHTLYILNEPTTGLHQADVGVLLDALNRLIGQGHTVILIEHHMGLIAAADHIIDLGPGSGRDGGNLMFSGTPEELVKCKHSLTARALKEYRILNIEQRMPKFFPGGNEIQSPTSSRDEKFELQNSMFKIRNSITFKGVATHNLKHLDVSIPHNKITVITGVSGSGKSSLAFDTIFAEGQNRFLESFSPYVRSRIGIREKADFEEVASLTPTFAVNQGGIGQNPRSTIGTMTGIYDHYRLLFSRLPHPASRIPHPASSLFSFNHQHGACPVCDGLGSQTVCDPDRLITDPEKPVMDGAMDGTKTGKFYGDPFGQYMASLRSAGSKRGIDFMQPWMNLTEDERKIALEGTGDEQYDVNWQFRRDNRTGEHHFSGPWKGLINLVNEEYSRKHADHRGESMMKLMKTIPCGSCGGSRLRAEALEYRILGKNIAELSALPVSGSIAFFRSMAPQLSDPGDHEVALPLIGEILRKLEFISGLGLAYLTMDRMSSTLSGGEAQRIRLAGQLGSGLTGITYVLDEPTIGLHPKDTRQLMKLIRSLQEAGNTVVIVEHDREVILAADHVIDMGPGAGRDGGMILAEGTPEEISRNPKSVTGPYLLQVPQLTGPDLPGMQQIPANSHHRKLKPGLFIGNAFANNLKGLDLEIPAAGIIAITGVSGSGKSTLMNEVILASWENKRPTGCSMISGFEHFQRIVCVHQRTGFSSPLSTPASFTGIFDRIRELFAGTPEANLAGFSKNSFSYLNKSGQCPACEGMGQIRISMDFLSDVRMVCEQCHGKRFSSEILQCTYNGLNIADVLDMTVKEATIFFSNQNNLATQLQMLEKVGLGYLQLGQPLDTLSGGEAQRLVLATELMKPGKGTTLYLFEEPSTGLHFRDIGYLMTLFHQLADQGHTLLVIEHDRDIINQADYILELGPEGGELGGYVMPSL
jgi:excinuclease ABC subunit A